MAGRNLHDWHLVLWLAENQIWLFAGVLTLVVALIRAYFDHVRITRQDIADALLCAVFVTVSRPLVAWAGFDDDWAMFYGVIIAMIGARFMRPLIETTARTLGGRFSGNGNHGR